MKTNKDAKVKSTKEICRVNYGKPEDYKTLMVQTYTSGKPFYTVEHGRNKWTPVETSSEDLDKIIKHLEKCYKIDKSSYKGNNKEVIAAIKSVVDKDKEFIDLAKKYKSKH